MKLIFIHLLFSLILNSKITIAQVDKDYSVFKNKADACFNSGDYDCAKINYEKALAIKSGDTYCIQKLKVTMQKKNQNNNVQNEAKRKREVIISTQDTEVPHYGNLYGLFDTSGDKYDFQGIIYYNRPHGKGRALYANGDTFSGSYSNGLMYDKGKYTWKNENIYEGDWVQSKMEGKGKFAFHNGDLYEGEFKKGFFDGEGKYSFKKGSVYDGSWFAGIMNGTGKFIYENGDIYYGNYLNGKQEGVGIIVYINGDFYEGSFKNNQFDGKGKYTWKSGIVWEGEWIEGEQKKQLIR